MAISPRLLHRSNVVNGSYTLRNRSTGCLTLMMMLTQMKMKKTTNIAVTPLHPTWMWSMMTTFHTQTDLGTH
jgi:hypothetical protein